MDDKLMKHFKKLELSVKTPKTYGIVSTATTAP